METIAKQVKKKLEPERSKVIDDILEEYPSCNSEQVEHEADRRMLEQYVDEFVKKFQNYMLFFYHLKCSDIYKAIIDMKDDKMVDYEEEHEDFEMTNEKELDLLLDTIAENRDMYEDLFLTE